jgi:uncharacterized protein YhjY with autotransporter beta-barrel domain
MLMSAPPRRWLGIVLTAATVLFIAEPAAAQTGFLDTTGYGFSPVNGPIQVTQALGDGRNIAGIVQLEPNPFATVNQTGFYSRSAIVQVDTNNTASIAQVGDFSHAFVIQVGPTNASTINQTGNKDSAIVIQLAASNIALFGPGYLERLASNLLFAPETAAALPSIGQISGQSFTRSLFSQLDTGRTQACVDQQPMPPHDSCRLAIFVQGNYQHGNHADTFGSTNYGYNAGSALLGVKFFVTPNFTIGPTFNYTRTAVTFEQGLGSTNLDAFQLGGFAAFDTNSLFIHAVAAHGWNNYDIARTGFFSPINASTSGNTTVAALKAGYLFDFNVARVGPIAGVSYSETRVKNYSEFGDQLLTQTVDGQELQSTIVSAGLRFRPQFFPMISQADTWIDVTIEKDQRNSMRVLETRFTLASDVSIYTPVSPKNDAYARVAGGFGLNITPNTRLDISAEALYASNNNNSVGLNVGFRAGF